MVVIQTQNGANWYAFFYTLSFLIVFILLLISGKHKSYPTLPWLLTIIAGSLFFIAGTKLFLFHSSDWKLLFSEGILQESTRKSAIGGVLLGMVGILLAQRWLRLSDFVLDTYAIILPIGLAIQKAGCLLAGCCFGIPTEVPWGIRYAEGSIVHFHHVVTGLNTISSTASLPVHPVPVYEMIAYLSMTFIILISGRYFQKRGAKLMLAIVLFCLFRWGIEFLRDPVTTLTLAEVQWGMKILQWVLLLTAILFGTLLILLPGIRTHPAASQRIRMIGHWRNLSFLLLLSFLIWLVRDWYAPMELMALNIALIPGIILFGIQIYRKLTVPRLRYIGVGLLIFPIFLMSQTLPTGDTLKNRIHSIGLGTNLGGYNQHAAYNPHEGNCGTTYDHKDFKHKYTLAGIEYNYEERKGFQSVNFGNNLFLGVDNESEYPDGRQTSHFMLGLNPYLFLNSRWIGGGVGLHIGNLGYIPVEPIEKNLITSGLVKYPILPSFRLRLGPYDIVDLEYRYRDQFPTHLPGITHQLSLGSGFGLSNGTTARIGIGSPGVTYYFGFTAVTKQKITLQAQFGLGENNYGNNHQIVTFGVRYNFLSGPKVEE